MILRLVLLCTAGQGLASNCGRLVCMHLPFTYKNAIYQQLLMVPVCHRREMSPDSALLRVQHHCGMVPAANGGNAAAHLINFALHRVAQRLRSSRDPRMRSLREVTHLQSLWMGDKTNFKSSHRQPLRRRRGDVHGDLSAAVLRLQWHGGWDVFVL